MQLLLLLFTIQYILKQFTFLRAFHIWLYIIVIWFKFKPIQINYSLEVLVKNQTIATKTLSMQNC